MQSFAAFSHIYIEESLAGSPEAAQVLSHFPQARVVLIHHYKELFQRRRQDIEEQHRQQKLILAKKEGTLFYPGAPVCQSFSEEHFYYTSLLMNCVYDCDYCYLKGMYPSGNLVLFLNLPDYFSELGHILQKHPVYLCVSYDTDLLAMEEITGILRAFTGFAASQGELLLEIRTKSGNQRVIRELSELAGASAPQLIFAFTISPEELISSFEKRTALLSARLEAMKTAMSCGFPVRLCLDPMILVPGWKEAYAALLERLCTELPLEQLRDVSIGSFRISDAYLKNLRRALPDSLVVQYPFENHGGYYQYPKALVEELEGFLLKRLEPLIGREKIFRWKEQG